MTIRGGVLRETTPSSMPLPDLNTLPYNCVRENSLQLSGYVLASGVQGPWFKSCPNHIFLPCIYLFVVNPVRKKRSNKRQSVVCL